MSVVQNLYQIFKIPASFLVENDCNVENYTISKGLKDGNIVSIGDNLVFQQIRYHYGDYRDHRQLFKYITKLRNNAHMYKKEGKYKESQILCRRITDVLFVKDVINVYVDGKKSDFHKFRTDGFCFNGIHYVYFCSGSGQIRRNTATFINAELSEKLTSILNCGLDKKTKQFVLAKYSAYFALSFSSILWVRTPRVCVIKDFFRNLENTDVDFIIHDETGKSVIEKRVMDLELNCADGQGLIDPTFAQRWSEDMDLPYTPCSFVARSCFVKGNLVTFDFKEYARQHNITTICDKWGYEHNIEDIDVMLSESQFKTHKYYSSWDDYMSYATAGNIHWGVARYSKQHDDEFVLANYQYIQSLDICQEDIANLIQPTVDWIKQICSGDPLYTMLYSFGPKDQEATYQNMYSTAQTNTMKAIVKNSDFLKDSYVQQKIYKNITETINKAKLGKIQIRGNYQFMIADPLAQCQAALGLEPTGLLKKDQIYSGWWRERYNENVTLDTCRSPMIDVHEHNPMTLVTDNPDADYWYQYLYSGIIYNTYDTSCFRHEDSDYDGDIVLSTDNKYFIKGSHKDHNVITYEKGLATPAKMTIPNITKTVMKGFGSGVGGFSNTATILYAMAAIFNKPEQKDQHDEIMQRIKLLREIVGQEIDRIKGADKPSLPAYWKQYESVSPDDTPEEKTRKVKHNAMVISKKPYFFRYLYPELNQRYKQFEDSYNQVSKDMFGMKFKKLLKKENKTDEEKLLVHNYQKYSPLITSDCTMNHLCREFESVDFDIKFNRADSAEGTREKKKNISLLPTFEDKFADSFSDEKLDFVKSLYKTYNARRQIKHLNALLNTSMVAVELDDYSEVRSSVYMSIIEDLQRQLLDYNMPGDEFLFYTNRLSYQYSNFNWGFAWDILEEQIIKLIPQGTSYCPIRDPEHGTSYLGVNYSLKDVTYIPEDAMDEILTTILEDTDFSFVSSSEDANLYDDILRSIKDERLDEDDDGYVAATNQNS